MTGIEALFAAGAGAAGAAGAGTAAAGTAAAAGSGLAGALIPAVLGAGATLGASLLSGRSGGRDSFTAMKSPSVGSPAVKKAKSDLIATSPQGLLTPPTTGRQTLLGG